MGWLEPKNTIRSWLEILKSNDSVFSQQAYGELLLIYDFHYKDTWSREIIHRYIQEQSNEPVLCGLAHSANYFWINPQIRPIAAEILQSLATSSSRHVQKVVARFFQHNRESFRVDVKTIGIIQSVYKNPIILAEAASDLVSIFADENLVDTRPDLVVEVFQKLLCMNDNTTQSVEGITMVADMLTTIAIQLHRHPLYREDGLKIFERLLELNLSETKEALETLDRKPSRAYAYTRRRRRRK